MNQRDWTKNLVNVMLTDFYQITMMYAYWYARRHNKRAVFDLFFRKSAFGGEYNVYCGLEESLQFIENFGFDEEQIAYIRSQMPHADPEFFEWLATVDCSDITVHAIPEGSVVFPRVPLMRISGPLAIAQLLETTLLNLNNFGTLCATNAARFRRAAGASKILMEFGLRRAQGPDGGMTASRCCYIGGFDATSNVQAGFYYGIPIKGTHAHAFVQSFKSLSDLYASDSLTNDPMWKTFAEEVLDVRQDCGFMQTNESELAAFIAYACAFPDNFLALVDTYDTLSSGVPNFICVARALKVRGYTAKGIRLDSGDLAFLSLKARKLMDQYGLQHALITASNDINEDVLISLGQQEHAIDAFGIGTSLVTCQAQPALGGVYKLVQVDAEPRIKLSQDAVKITIPGEKNAFRLLDVNDQPIMDVMILCGEDPPAVGQPFYCRHPFVSTKRANVTPSRVAPLYECVWKGVRCSSKRSLAAIREYAMAQVNALREDIVRPKNPTPYKVSVSGRLYNYIQDLRESEAPVGELK